MLSLGLWDCIWPSPDWLCSLGVPWLLLAHWPLLVRQAFPESPASHRMVNMLKMAVSSVKKE